MTFISGGVSEPKSPTPVLFFRKVQEIPEEYGGCWCWTGGLTDGYGIFTYRDDTGKPRSFRAHRWSYVHHVGPIPKGLTLDHLCRVTQCVRPDHLEPVTSKVNIHRGVGVAPVNSAKTHCPQQHPYDEENTRINSQKRRVCITCERERSRKQYEKRKAALK